MKFTKSEVLKFVEENDVKFVKLAFCDLFGNFKNISIVANELSRAFDNGISFDASALKGFMNIDKSDLILFPDPSTLAILPWRPQHGRVIRFLCDLKYPDGTPFEGDGRQILKKAVSKASSMGYKIKIGAEGEFYLMHVDETGMPIKIPHDYASFLDVAPLDKGENIRREICLTLEEMGINPESSHHEKGPGQNEIVFTHSTPLSSADNFVTFRQVVQAIAERNGLFATFMPKPYKDFSGSGMHINLSLYNDKGENIFFGDNGKMSDIAENFTAGIIQRITEITLFTNPLGNSYERFGRHEAPKYISWSSENRSQLIRIPFAKKSCARVELRSPDSMCNPYIAFSLLIYAGLEGIENNLKLKKCTNINLYTCDKEFLKNFEKLPDTLSEAVDFARNSDFVRRYLPENFLEKFYQIKIQEWQEYKKGIDHDNLLSNTFSTI